MTGNFGAATGGQYQQNHRDAIGDAPGQAQVMSDEGTEAELVAQPQQQCDPPRTESSWAVTLER